MKAITLLCSALTLSTILSARDKSDVLVMRNGDHLTCEIKSLDSNVLNVSLDYALGTISLDWSKIDHIESKQLFLITTEDGKVYSGTLSMQKGRPMKVQAITAPAGEIDLDKEEIAKVEQTAETFWQRFNGQIGLGAIYSRGNQSAQYNLNADVNYPREGWSAGGFYSSNLATNSKAPVSTRNEVNVSALRLLRWNNWYYTGLTDFLQSSQQGITLQTTVGGGIGRYLKRSAQSSISVTGGFAWQKINYQHSLFPSTSQQVGAVLIDSQLTLYYFDRTTLNVNAMLLPAVSDPGRVHFNLNTAYYVKIWRRFTWDISFYGNWDNRPPPGFSGSDYGSSSGVSWKFGNR